MIKYSFVIFRIIPVLVLAIHVVMLTGCAKQDEFVIAPNPSYSVNIVSVPDWWPREEGGDWSEDPLQARLQQEVYNRMGKPEFFRIVWRRDRKLVTQDELGVILHRNEPLIEQMMEKGPEFEWVYPAKGKIVHFEPDHYEIRGMEDTVDTIISYGDPHEIKSFKEPGTGVDMLNYQYYSEGKIFYFRDGKLFKEEDTFKHPGWEKRR